MMSQNKKVLWKQPAAIMSEPQKIKPRVCCRLCLAAQDECVNLFKTPGADKQPLTIKINACLQIKVHENDRLSPMICHACISYLNSWQSFKNRSDAAQKKQKSWINEPVTPGASLLKQSITPTSNQSISALKPAMESAQQGYIQKQAELQKQKLIQLAKHQQLQNLKMQHLKQQQQRLQPKNEEFDTGFIKSESQGDGSESAGLDDDESENVTMDLDPSQFLAGSDDDDDDATREENGPPILTSLGLTHINHVNPFMPNESDYQADESMTEPETTMPKVNGGSSTQKPAGCTICDMVFSNRANARRHEKNIHGVHHTPMINNSSNNSLMLTSTAPKPRSRPKKALTEQIDYSNPSKYRHMLTQSKLSFILKNLNFLEQIQDMKCTCCDKQFPSYKFFMGHMRKKYNNLPRNVCFKCLRQFSSKGQFIGHLKRKTCINLYKIVMNDDTISKDVSFNNGKIPNKDVLANKVYGCKICSGTFRLKVEFRDHVYREHPEVQKNRETPSAACIHCNEIFTDTGVRRRHFNNLDCIVYITCGTCKDYFENHASYIEHVYRDHLTPKEEYKEEVGGDEAELSFEAEEETPNTTLRTMQNCPVCDKQYNNYYNVLRHMESKHPNQLPQIYQCPVCKEGFPRQSELRDHLMVVHQRQMSGAVKPTKLPAYICKDCKATFDTKNAWIDHQEEHVKFSCMFCEYEAQYRVEFEEHLENVHQNYNGDKLDQSDDFVNPNIKDEDGNSNDINIADQINGTAEADENLPMQPYLAKRIKCRFCNRRVDTKTGLKMHMQQEHGLVGDLAACQICPAEFLNDKGLKVHLYRSHSVRDPELSQMLLVAQQQHKLKSPQRLAKEAELEAEKAERDAAKLAKENAMKNYECQICHIVYKAMEQLRSHHKMAHNIDDDLILDSMPTMNIKEEIFDEFESDENKPEVVTKRHVVGDHDVEEEDAMLSCELWYQCRYCQRSFNSSKKLTIHMHSHEAIDQTDYSCKDCGNPYASKKSLWVHRHKKHPRVPDPTPCDVCQKILFDKTEHYFHTLTHSDTYFNDSLFGGTSGEVVDPSPFLDSHPLFSLLDVDEKPMDTAFKNQQLARSQQIREQQMQNSSASRKRTIGSVLKQDKMDKDGDGVNEFACDMCPKTFPVANALQVHRGWHFRSPDGRKVRDPKEMWRPDQVPPSKVRRVPGSSRASEVQAPAEPPQPPVCPHCNSKFASHNNLRRHIIEVHKRYEVKDEFETKIDKVGECTKCRKTFSTLAEWVDHKIADARNKRMLANYEWNCDICNKMFTRKERLLQHMLSHLNDREMDPEVLAAHYANLENGLNSDEQDDGEEQYMGEEEQEAEENDQESDNQSEKEYDGEEQIVEEDSNSYQMDHMIKEEYYASDLDEPDEPQVQEEEVNNPGFSCQLCQVFFESSADLRKHVSEHFLNGGIDETQGTQDSEDEEEVLEAVEQDEEDMEEIEQEESSSSSEQSTNKASVPLERFTALSQLKQTKQDHNISHSKGGYA